MPETPTTWTPAATYEDIRYELSGDGIAKITINRPEVHNAFRPADADRDLGRARSAREDTSVGVIILTGEGDRRLLLGWATSGCAATPATSPSRARRAPSGRFHVTDLHIQMRRLPKPIIAMVAGYAIGGGHVLHLVCDLTIAADNAKFGQVGPKVGSFDGGFGAGSARPDGRREEGQGDLVPVRAVLRRRGPRDGHGQQGRPLADLEAETVAWARRMLTISPFALRLMKASFNAAEDGLAGIQQLAHDANLLFYSTEEARRAARPSRPSGGPSSRSSPSGPDVPRRGRRAAYRLGQASARTGGMRSSLMKPPCRIGSRASGFSTALNSTTMPSVTRTWVGTLW
jgi:naphthoate synthase